MMATLVDLTSQQRLELADRISIGRAPTCDVQIDDPMVSANHAEIVRQPDGSFVVRDLGSRRGTFVGSRKIGETMLHDGDETADRTDPAPLRSDRRAATATSFAGCAPWPSCRARSASSNDLDGSCRACCETCFQLLRADRGSIIVFLPAPRRRAPPWRRRVMVSRLRTPCRRACCRRSCKRAEPYLRTEVDGDIALQRSASLSAQGVRSLIAVRSSTRRPNGNGSA